jgi:hypothetical protein
MIMKAVIFLGPSLPIAEARQILDAIYLPPAQAADLVSVVTTYQPDAIGLVDGYFSQSLSVWHKEILYALDRGICVYGSSSMGALRAAETAVFGMVGVGQVYEWFASGELNDDDEVAISHGDAESGYLKLSEPMVNLRATLQAARDQQVITLDECNQLIAVAKALFFPERTWHNIWHAAPFLTTETRARLKSFIDQHYIDVKRLDAIRLLETIRDLQPSPATKQFDFTRSFLFDTLYYRDRTVPYQDMHIPLSTIANHVALHMTNFNDLNERALNRMLVLVMADMLQVEVTQEEIDKEQARFCLRHRLKPDTDLKDWQARNHLDQEEFRTLMSENAKCRRMQRWLITRLVMVKSSRVLLDELRLENSYEEWLARTADQEKLVAQHADSFQQTGESEIDLRQLVIDHLRQTGLRMNVRYEEWAEEAGFHTLDDLKIELLRARLARQVLQSLVTQAASIFVPPAENNHDS